MRIHTSVVTAAVALALAVPAVAGAATPANHHYAPAVVVSPVYPGTSSISGGCTLTMVAGHVSSVRCEGSTMRQASAGNCTLTVAAARLWTYSCPSVTSGSAVVQGASSGAIPSSCTAIAENGFRLTFSCPRKAFGGTRAAGVPAATKKADAGTAITRLCGPPLAARSLASEACALL